MAKHDFLLGLPIANSFVSIFETPSLVINS